jgi:hypothetical protein
MPFPGDSRTRYQIDLIRFRSLVHTIFRDYSEIPGVYNGEGYSNAEANNRNSDSGPNPAAAEGQYDDARSAFAAFYDWDLSSA